MESGDFSTGLGLGDLAPAASVGRADGQPRRPETEREMRRRSRRDSEDDETHSFDPDKDDGETQARAHQLDSLA